jgi:hypothetical protein
VAENVGSVLGAIAVILAAVRWLNNRQIKALAANLATQLKPFKTEMIETGNGGTGLKEIAMAARDTATQTALDLSSFRELYQRNHALLEQHLIDIDERGTQAPAMGVNAKLEAIGAHFTALDNRLDQQHRDFLTLERKQDSQARLLRTEIERTDVIHEELVKRLKDLPCVHEGVDSLAGGRRRGQEPLTGPERRSKHLSAEECPEG